MKRFAFVVAMLAASTAAAVSITRALVAGPAQLGSGAKSSIETFINNNVCPLINAQLVASGGTSNCAAGRDGDVFEVVWQGGSAHATFRSAHPWNASPQ